MIRKRVSFKPFRKETFQCDIELSMVRMYDREKVVREGYELYRVSVKVPDDNLLGLLPSPRVTVRTWTSSTNYKKRLVVLKGVGSQQNLFVEVHQGTSEQVRNAFLGYLVKEITIVGR